MKLFQIIIHILYNGFILYFGSLDFIINKIDLNSDLLILGCTHLIAIKEEFRKRVKIDVLSQDELFISLFK